MTVVFRYEEGIGYGHKKTRVGCNETHAFASLFSRENKRNAGW